jgi:hypothetical protein
MDSLRLTGLPRTEQGEVGPPLARTRRPDHPEVPTARRFKKQHIRWERIPVVRRLRMDSIPNLFDGARHTVLDQDQRRVVSQGCVGGKVKRVTDCHVRAASILAARSGHGTGVNDQGTDLTGRAEDMEDGSVAARPRHPHNADVESGSRLVQSHIGQEERTSRIRRGVVDYSVRIELPFVSLRVTAVSRS